MKGCALFSALFLLGAALMVAGLVQDLMVEGFEASNSVSMAGGGPDRSSARIFELSGLVLMFGAIYGAAGWRFYLQYRGKNNHASTSEPRSD